MLWGSSGLFVHFLAPYGFSSLQLTAVRGTVAFLCMLGFVLVKRRAALRIPLWQIPLFLGIGVSLFGTAACYFISMQATSVATAVVLMYTAPVYVLIFSILFLKERLTPIKAVAIASTLLGGCFVSGVIGGLRLDLFGILMGLLSGISYGAYNILTKIALQKNASPCSTTLYGFFFMSLIALSASRPLEIFTYTATQPAILIPVLIGLGIVTYIIPYVLYTLGLRGLPAGTASALGIIEPMTATIYAALFLKQELSVLAVVGIVLILAAVPLLSRSEQQHSEKQETPSETA